MYFLPIVGVVTGIVGIVQGVIGSRNLKQAKAISNESQTNYYCAASQLENNLKNTNEIAQKYAEVQVKSYKTIERYFDLTTQYPDLTHLEPKVLERLELCRKNPLALNLQPTIKNGILSAVSEAIISTADNLVTIKHYLRVRNLKMSKLENPRRIESLALNSTKGHGILLASTIVGPALMAGGFKLAEAGQQALTEAEIYRGQIQLDIEQLKTVSFHLQAVNLRLKELVTVVELMNNRATILMTEFSGTSFIQNPVLKTLFCAFCRQVPVHKDLSRFWAIALKVSMVCGFRTIPELIKIKQTQLLIEGLLEILTTPVLNKNKKLNAGIAQIIEQYKTLNV